MAYVDLGRVELVTLESNVNAFKQKQFHRIKWFDKEIDQWLRLTTKQIKFFEKLTDQHTRFIGYGGGARGGKTICGTSAALFTCYAYPGTAALIGRAELTNLRRTTLKTLFRLMLYHDLKEGTDYNYNKQDHIIRFKNGSEIILMDTRSRPSDPLQTKFGGLEITWAFIDESNETDLDVITTIYSRCGNRNNTKYGLLGKVAEGFNPDKGHVYRRYWKPFRDGTMPNNRHFIRALASDNPSPQANEYVQQLLESGDKIKIERLVNGNFEYDDDPTNLFDYDALNDMFTNDHVRTGNAASITADIALEGSDKMVVVVWKGWSVVEKIYAFDKTNGKEVIDNLTQIKRRHGVPNSRIIYDDDGIGSFVKSFLSGCKPFKNGSVPVRKENFENLKTQCFYKFADQVNSGNIWIQDDRYKEQIIEELQVIKTRDEDKDGKKKINKKEDVKSLLGRSPDFAEALMMFSYMKLNMRRPANQTALI